MIRQVYPVVVVALVIGGGCGETVTENIDPKLVVPQIKTHPVFHTLISGQSQSRPAIQVDIIDDSEDTVFTAELYLSVQSSRFPKNTWILLPLNVGDFAGARTRFVQLPFEVHEGETLLFNLLDDDELSSEQEEMIVKGCRSAGYCLLVAGQIYCPPAARLANPVVSIAAEVLGDAIVQEIGLHHFENFGTAEYIVPRQLPNEPHQANELSVRDENNYVPVVLKLYGPPHTLHFQYEDTTST